MTYMVTGGAGFIGSNFLHFLRRKTDEEIVVLDNLTYAADLRFIPRGQQFQFEWCDITNEEHVHFLFEKYAPRKVWHFAAESHVDNSITNYRPFLESNVVGTINLLNASLNMGIEKFHHISTDEVYGSLEYDDVELFKEDTPYNPSNPYSASKAASDHYVKTWHNTYDLPYLITNCSNNYGRHQHEEKLIPKIIKRAMKDQNIFMYGGGQQIRDWLSVVDHCKAIWSLEECGIINDQFNIGGGCEMRNIDVTKMVLDAIDKPYGLIGISDQRPGQDKRYAIDHGKITKTTGWEPAIEFELGLRATVSWYLERWGM